MRFLDTAAEGIGRRMPSVRIALTRPAWGTESMAHLNEACMGEVVGLVRHGRRHTGEGLRPQQQLALHDARYDLGRLLVCAHLLEGCQEAAWTCDSIPAHLLSPKLMPQKGS